MPRVGGRLALVFAVGLSALVVTQVLRVEADEHGDEMPAVLARPAQTGDARAAELAAMLPEIDLIPKTGRVLQTEGDATAYAFASESHGVCLVLARTGLGTATSCSTFDGIPRRGLLAALQTDTSSVASVLLADDASSVTWGEAGASEVSNNSALSSLPLEARLDIVVHDRSGEVLGSFEIDTREEF
jgi:hypothetical protein